jgi:hypothetical protein
MGTRGVNWEVGGWGFDGIDGKGLELRWCWTKVGFGGLGKIWKAVVNLKLRCCLIIPPHHSSSIIESGSFSMRYFFIS